MYPSDNNVESEHSGKINPNQTLNISQTLKKNMDTKLDKSYETYRTNRAFELRVGKQQSRSRNMNLYTLGDEE